MLAIHLLKVSRFILLILSLLWCTDASSRIKPPKDPKEIYKLAVQLAKKQEYKNALRYFRYLHKLRPKNQKIAFYLARTFLKSNYTYQALQLCKRIQESPFDQKCQRMKQNLKSKNPDQYSFYLARLEYRDQKLDKAYQRMEELIKRHIGDPKMRLLIGRIFEARGELEFAKDSYDFAYDEIGRENQPRVLEIQKALTKRVAAEVSNISAPGIQYDKDFFDSYFRVAKLSPRDLPTGLDEVPSMLTDHLLEMIANDEGETFGHLYQIGYLFSMNSETMEAKEAYLEAQKSTRDPILIATLDYLLDRLE